MEKPKYDLELEKQRRELNAKSKAYLVERLIEERERLEYARSLNTELREGHVKEITELKVNGYEVLMRYFKR